MRRRECFFNHLVLLLLMMSVSMMTACGGAGQKAEGTALGESGILSESGEVEGTKKASAEDSETASEKKEQQDAASGESKSLQILQPSEEKQEKQDLGDNQASGKKQDPKKGQNSQKSQDSEMDQNPPEAVQKAPAVVLGDERTDIYLPLLDGKRVALFTNQTGIVGNKVNVKVLDEDKKTVPAPDSPNADSTEEAVPDKLSQGQDLIPFGENADGTSVEYGEHILDALLRQGVDVTSVFVPEHGFRGTDDAGANIHDSVDEKTGVPIISLYGGSSSGSSAENMDRFDTLVIDIQDVGLRYYTYYITMYRLIDACAAAGKDVVILDRPNPNGFYVDGPILRDEYPSGVGILPIPVVHGMTLGELAQMMNGEGWLSTGKDSCPLTVIPCENYTHETKTNLIIKPSPNLKDMRAIYLYASTCYFENTAISVGRGTTFPFEAYGSPCLQGAEGFDFVFTPESMQGAAAPLFEGQDCYGKDLRDIPLEQIWEEQINLNYVIDAYHAFKEQNPGIEFFESPDGKIHCWIDYLFGTDQVRHMIEEGRSAEEIRESWQKDVEAFMEQRRPYLLYED